MTKVEMAITIAARETISELGIEIRDRICSIIL